IFISSICFADEANKDWNDELREAIQANENEVVEHYEEDKIYINPEKIHPTPQGVYLNLNDQEFIFVPTLNSDNQGCYIKCLEVLNTCPGCGNKYFLRCDNPNCRLMQDREKRREDNKREKEYRKEEKIGEKESKKHKKH